MMHKLGGLDTSPRLRPLPSVHLCRPEFVADAQAMPHLEAHHHNMMHELGGLDTPRRLRLFPAIHPPRVPEFLVDAHALVTGHKSYCVVNCVNWFRSAGDLVRHHELRLQAFPAGWERLRGSGQPHLEAHRRNMMHKLGGLDTSPRLRPLPSVHLCRPEFVADAQAMVTGDKNN
ncbi:hypothetical protein V5799_004434 [Amblyomma americanum]|uniref:Uncharacterized protein n=1 Tax=Amblyomma americanum TaxID=6943 RepID=A0AAQ4D644_AMBAM